MEDFMHDNRVYYSAIDFALSFIGGTWKIPILIKLSNGPLRYGDLKKAIPHITDKMLNTQIRDLEKKKMLSRTIYREKPPRVEYALTGRGYAALPFIQSLQLYGELLMQEEKNQIKALDQ